MKDYKEIDIVGIFNLLWSKRLCIIKNCFYAGVLAIVLAFSIPKEYSSTVVLAPEFSSPLSGLSGSLGTLASMAGVELGSSTEEALYPELYPQIVSSAPFLSDLLMMDIQGKYKKEPISTNLYTYIRTYQREPWWGKILGAPSKLVQRLSNRQSDTLSVNSLKNIRNLTRRQQLIMKILDSKIVVHVDKGTNVITLTATMQDPEIAADVAQAVSDRLQEYVGNYRTAKARKDLAQTELIYQTARDNYYAAQQAYAEYSDQHQGVVKKKYQIEEERLANEQELAFGVYNQIAQQLEISKTKLLDKTPVVVVMQPAVVPYKASSPQKMMMGISFVFLAFFGTCGWYILKDKF